MGTAQHQEAAQLKEIQFQVEMGGYTVTLSGFSATAMDTFSVNFHINNQKQLIFQRLELC